MTTSHPVLCNETSHHCSDTPDTHTLMNPVIPVKVAVVKHHLSPLSPPGGGPLRTGIPPQVVPAVPAVAAAAAAAVPLPLLLLVEPVVAVPVVPLDGGAVGAGACGRTSLLLMLSPVPLLSFWVVLLLLMSNVEVIEPRKLSARWITCFRSLYMRSIGSTSSHKLLKFAGIGKMAVNWVMLHITYFAMSQ